MAKKVKITIRLARAVTRPISRRIKAVTLFPPSACEPALVTSDISLSFPLLVNCREFVAELGGKFDDYILVGIFIVDDSGQATIAHDRDAI